MYNYLQHERYYLIDKKLYSLTRLKDRLSGHELQRLWNTNLNEEIEIKNKTITRVR